MHDYQKMYTKLFNAITDAIHILQKAQQSTEETYITQPIKPKNQNQFAINPRKKRLYIMTASKVKTNNIKGEVCLEDIETLREALIAYVKKKFYTRHNILEMAEEIVNQTFLAVMNAPCFNDDQYNFGYMSTACLRTAYKLFHRNDRENEITVNFELTAPLISEDSFIDELERSEDTKDIIQSLMTLKQIEQVIINERYYGNLTFREISHNYGINLNTVLSHHRRALKKLRPILSPHFNNGK